ncbi:transglutaminase-like cysteine peptidase [Photobacterium leiognathi]|uniref:transglutaminase-like cysteine peptidase n=1 Tax=Photobacterium leiognathi TaxID=553611 RepID=UPI002738319E|nr:transglutaminase-like cysteine peptidase [Photobacterium leiognathi]
MNKNAILKHLKKVIIGTTLITATTSAFATDYVKPYSNYAIKYGEKGLDRLHKLNAIMDKHKNSSTETKLKVINNFFNKFSYMSDIKLWGKDDYWASPIEFLGVGVGDCEDYAIAKHDALLRMGISNEKLRLIYVKTHSKSHMVLGYFDTDVSQPLILDNLSNNIVPVNIRTDLTQVYSFNENGLWVVKNGVSALAGNSNRLSLWNDVSTRTAMQTPIVDYTI